MAESRPQHPTRVPWRFREVRPGPRGNLFDALLVTEVCLTFAGLFGAWLCVRAGRTEVGVFLAVLGLAFPVIMAVQVRRMRGFRDLSRRGAIAVAEVTGTRLTYLSFRPRADSRWPRPALPGFPLLMVRYAYTDEKERRFHGDFLISRREARRFSKGRRIEIFYALDRPSLSASGLVMRWYYLLSGAEPTEESIPFHPFGADPFESTDVVLPES